MRSATTLLFLLPQEDLKEEVMSMAKRINAAGFNLLVRSLPRESYLLACRSLLFLSCDP